MSRAGPRWKWDFEDDGRARRPPPAPSPPPPAPPSGDGEREELARRARFRLRRGIAAGVLVLLLAVVIALSGSNHHAASHRAGASTHTPLRAGPTPDRSASEKQAVLSTLAYTPFVKEGSREVRDIALTFDDGPGPYTPQVLSVLEHEHVPATFFAIGKMERYFS
ncbi:MAG TPA: polysaccharide deacetylase family protein, partial [Solirubrobacteraceae bacterium]|nr:polysaccharide deacetylase family protein [Solirubrobacteraceae bacterium]